jgi:hypothetical protein
MSAPILRHDWAWELRQLPEEWDGENARRITDAAIAKVGSFAAVPCYSGGIQLEFHCDGLDVEIEIAADGRVETVLVGSSRVAPSVALAPSPSDQEDKSDAKS